MKIVNSIYYWAPIVISVYVSSCNTLDKGKAPNILVAISDDQSFHTSINGVRYVQTPAFDRVAKEGALFMNAFVSSPICAPSRSAIVTGRHFWQNEQSGQHSSSWMKKHVPFVDLLEQGGYATGQTGKGLSPFQLARDKNDSLWRAKPIAGVVYNEVKYMSGDDSDERTSDMISSINYFENFKSFLETKSKEKPFFFWYGAREPHRPYQEGSWMKQNKHTDDVNPPEPFPDHEVVKGDLLDYAVEIEWFDTHLGRMINYLEKIDELDNTIIIVTSDNGMPFTHSKSNTYELGTQVPLAIRYPQEIESNTVINGLVSLIDLAPTILDYCNIDSEGMLPITGKSMRHILKANSHLNDSLHKYVFSGKERHSSARFDNLGYPVRSIRSSCYLLIWNMKPERWPVGDPQRAGYPVMGVNENGNYLERSDASVFTDIPEGPTKTFLIENRKDSSVLPFFEKAFLKRPEFEFYNVKDDPFCMKNLYQNPDYQDTIKVLYQELIAELTRTRDPRIVGPDKEIFDKYSRYGKILEFQEESTKETIF